MRPVPSGGIKKFIFIVILFVFKIIAAINIKVIRQRKGQGKFDAVPVVSEQVILRSLLFKIKFRSDRNLPSVKSVFYINAGLQAVPVVILIKILIPYKSG